VNLFLYVKCFHWILSEFVLVCQVFSLDFRENLFSYVKCFHWILGEFVFICQVFSLDFE
jgi:hypothetical protein